MRELKLAEGYCISLGIKEYHIKYEYGKLTVIYDGITFTKLKYLQSYVKLKKILKEMKYSFWK